MDQMIRQIMVFPNRTEWQSSVRWLLLRDNHGRDESCETQLLGFPRLQESQEGHLIAMEFSEPEHSTRVAVFDSVVEFSSGRGHFEFELLDKSGHVIPEYSPRIE